MPVSYRLVGERKSPRTLNVHSSISTTFRGNAKAALSTTYSDKTLGGKAYRLRPDAEERARHGVRCTNNSARFVAPNAPLTER